MFSIKTFCIFEKKVKVMKKEKKEQELGLFTALISLGLVGYVIYLAIKALMF